MAGPPLKVPTDMNGTTPKSAPWQYVRPPGWRRWVGLVRDVPQLVGRAAHAIADDDPRALQLAMAALLVAFLLSMLFWVGGYIVSRWLG